MRTTFAVLFSCLLLSVGIVVGPATAGEYNGGYGGGYNGRYNGGYDGGDNGGYNGRYYRGYNGGYNGYSRGVANVWYSSQCCYRKLVRHVREVRFVRTEPYRRYGYYDRPYRYGYNGGGYVNGNGYYGRGYGNGNGYYGRSYRSGYYGQSNRGYYGRPYHYGGGYYEGPRGGGYVSAAPRYDEGYDAYNSVSRARAQSCDKRRTRVPDGHNGWVWRVKTVC
jgi:hypothetical protein